MNSYFVIGGAGFIGSHFVDELLANGNKVSIYDNFSSGKTWHYKHHINNNNLTVFCGDVDNLNELKNSLNGHDVVIHLASNPDIAKAVTQPDIDFWQGTYLTNNVLEAMRQTGVKRLLYASGSGIYGDIGEIEATEDFGPLQPISTYGASKLAGEALINSYCHMFDITACVFRFGNVVGPRQTHGICYDFINRLLKDPTQLTVLGDGSQSKSYIYVTDVINAVLTANKLSNKKFEAYNVATGDYITVHEIVDLVINTMQLNNITNITYTGGDRGWKGDVPIVRLNTNKVRNNLNWNNQFNTKEAITKSIISMLQHKKELS